jgi:4-hydroxybenzoate polyprenyltransferase/phosphoserine phosphatase
MSTATPTTRPLCVDLDGTVIRTDLLHEGLLALLGRRPWLLALAPLWLLQGGRAGLKERVAGLVELDVTGLPYDSDLLAWLRRESAERKVHLVTAAHAVLARRVAAHVGIFDEVIASDARTNLKGRCKAERLVERFGVRGFDYVGNAAVDLAIWRECRRPVAANVTPAVAAKLKYLNGEALIFSTLAPRARAFVRALRPHQWSKNLLMFVPLILAHRITEASLVGKALLAFTAFSLVASAVYLLNDLVDLESDRAHPDKRRRPFAAGDLPVSVGAVAFPLLLLAGVGLAAAASAKLAAILGTYFLLTTAYSLRLKKIMMADVVFLACLYGVRLLAGGHGLGVHLSPWLLAFSIALFSSLALAKRVTEMRLLERQGRATAAGRGYAAIDREQLASLGSAAAYTALAVLMLYVNSEDVRALYKTPALLWLICPLLQYWLGRILLIANRGELHSDPIVFALKDVPSYAVGAAAALVVWAATI